MGEARFTRTREDFVCAHCGRQVRGTGYTNHCPSCLWSRHVDVNPGDRAAECGGMMAPVGVLFEQGGYVIVQACTECPHRRRNRATGNDLLDALLALAGRPVEDRRTPAPHRRR